MRLLIICGSHPRHRFILDEIIKIADDISVIVMEREDLIPSASKIENVKLKNIFELHFSKRYQTEKNAYGADGMSEWLKATGTRSKVLKLSPSKLNSVETIKFVLASKAELSIVMGAGLIGSKLLSVIPSNHINIHLGLSPWYRGSGTLFWPTFNWEPWKTGVTFHRLNEYADSGNIIHQSVCKLSARQGVHETALSAVQEAKKALPRVLDWMLKNPDSNGLKQPFTGRSYLSTQIKPEHLYDIHVLRGDKTIAILRKNEILKRSFKIYSTLP